MWTGWLIVAPIAFPLLGGLGTLLALRSSVLQNIICIAACLLQLVAAALLLTTVSNQEAAEVLHVGGWPAPFGIVLVADRLSSLILAFTSLLGLAGAVYGIGDLGPEYRRHGFETFYLLMLTGVTGALLTGDLFNLYVWFEVMLVSSLALIAFGEEPRQTEAAIKYGVLNLVGTVLLLTAIALLYSLTGTLNMADLALRVRAAAGENQFISGSAMLLLVALCIKSAAFPLFFWLPASYHTPTVIASAVFAGTLTKVGVYAILRMFTLVFGEDPAYAHTVLLVLAILTMLVGAIGATAQGDFRRVLSFDLIGQIGHMLMGVALMTPLAIAGSIFFVLHNVLAKPSLFLISGVVERLGGSMDLRRLGGIFRASPSISAFFLVAALSLSGIPPLSGFFGKLALVRASIEEGAWFGAAAILMTGFLTLFAMSRVWLKAFWRPAPERVPASLGNIAAGARISLVLPVATLAGGTVLLGVFSEPFLALSFRAAEELLDPSLYIKAVGIAK